MRWGYDRGVLEAIDYLCGPTLTVAPMMAFNPVIHTYMVMVEGGDHGHGGRQVQW